MKSTGLLQLDDNLQHAGKTHNLQQVCGVSGCVRQYVLSLLFQLKNDLLTRQGRKVILSPPVVVAICLQKGRRFLRVKEVIAHARNVGSEV